MGSEPFCRRGPVRLPCGVEGVPSSAAHPQMEYAYVVAEKNLFSAVLSRPQAQRWYSFVNLSLIDLCTIRTQHCFWGMGGCAFSIDREHGVDSRQRYLLREIALRTSTPLFAFPHTQLISFCFWYLCLVAQ